MSDALEDRDGYAGPATLEAAGISVSCDVVITGFFEPVTGRYKWYGRASGQRLDALPAKGARLRTPHASVETSLSDVDFWGRYRLQGFGRPPFPLPEAPAEAQPQTGMPGDQDG